MSAFAGTRRLVRLALRRDRMVLSITITLAVAMVAGSAVPLIEAYPSYEERLSYVAESTPSAAGRVFQGTVQGVNIGTILMAETYITASIIMAIMSILAVSRHTRYNEETGAGELISSMQVGRSAPLTAALVVAIGASLLTGLAIFGGLSMIQELDVVGSMYLGASLAMVGIFFAGVSAVTVQLSDYRRGANGLAMAVLGAFFLVRSFGDILGETAVSGLGVTAHWLTWLSPLGLGYQVLPYNGDHYQPLLILAVASLALFALGYYLLSKRDLGSGIFASRSGRPRAKRSLLSSFGLAVHLQKGGWMGWTVGFALTGWMIAAIVSDFKKVFTENEAFSQFLANAGADSSASGTILAAMLPMMAAILAGYIVSAMGKMQEEESSGRLEYLLGTALGRLRFLLSHVFTTVIGVAMSLGIMGLVAGWAYVSASGGNDLSVLDIVGSALVNLPAMLLFLSIILFVFAMFGRFVKAFAWSFYGYCALIASFASIYSLSNWLLDLSPFTHTPPYPSGSLDVAPLWIMSLIAVIIMTISVFIFTRRDISLK